MIARNSAWSLIGWVASILLGIVASPVIICGLGSEAYGVFCLLLTVIAPLGLFDMGLSEATVKYMAESFGRGNEREAESYFRTTLFFNIGAGVLGIGILYVLSDWIVTKAFNIPEAYHSSARLALHFVGVNWALTLTAQTYVGALMALQRYKPISLGTICVQIATTGTGIVVVACGGKIFALIASQTICGMVAVVLWFVVVRKNLPAFNLLPSWQWAAFRRTTGMGLWQLLHKIGGMVSSRAQYWLLGATLAVEAVGHFTLCGQVVTMLYLVSYKVGHVLFPAISNLQGAGKHEEAALKMVDATWLCSVVGLAGVAAIIALGPDILTLWVGAGISEKASGALQILGAANGVSMVFAVCSFFLLGTGRSKWLAIMAVAQGIVTFSTAYITIPIYGVNGAALGVLCSTVIHLTVMYLVWDRLIKTWVKLTDYCSAIYCPLLIAAVVALGFWKVRNLTGHTLSPFLVIAGSFVIAVVTATAIVGIDYVMPGGPRRRAHIAQLLGRFWSAANWRQVSV